MSDDDNDYKNVLRKHKPKKKLTVPTEFLDNAKSYEDKQMLVRVLTDREKHRVVLLVKNMLKDAVANKGKK